MNPHNSGLLLKQLYFVGLLMVLCSACSGGGSTSTVSANAGATLTDTKSSLQIPTGSFTEDVDVTISENQADTSNIGDVQLVSDPVTLEFSKARVVQSADPILLAIQLDAESMRKAISEGKGIYAKARVRGEQISYDKDGSEDDEWESLLGDLDPNSAILTVRLYSSAGAVDVVGVAGTGLKVVTIDPQSFLQSKSVKRSSRAQKAVNTVGMGQYPWAVVCDTDALSDHGAVTCDGANPNSMVTQVQNGLTDASRDLLTHLNMNELVMQQLSALSLGQTNLSTLPDPAVLRRHDPSVRYNMAYLTKGRTSSFTSATGILKIVESQVNNEYARNVGTVFHHELTHAVQTAICNNCASIDDAVNLNRNSPLSEGTATAVGMLASGGWSENALRNRYLHSVPRNWAHTLAKYNPYSYSYYAVEFFANANNGDLTYLMPLFRAFNGSELGVFNKRLDVAIQAALGKDLPEVFMKRVMPFRNSNTPNSIHYHAVDISNSDIDHSIATSVQAMASDQYLYRVNTNDDVCINVYLMKGDDPKLALVMLNGTEGGEPMPYGDDNVARMVTDGNVLTVRGNKADVQVINLSTGGVADKKDYTIDAYFDGACIHDQPPAPCNPLRVVCYDDGCRLQVAAPDLQCWATIGSCDPAGRCVYRNREGGFDFSGCDNLHQQMLKPTQNRNESTTNDADVPENHSCGDVDYCHWMVLCPK
ncbi:MAG: hypothetical protein COV45_02475 [Deltaproteobacteria bacterium CG11_big_fil_rev_8_21_14_0_20_47_16]|nr:MAG: hypothetical protein COV45_02475 [Deltaproteobacteria bacterium CG11_big_fil_rev_8_21_14_0_20_47_16]